MIGQVEFSRINQISPLNTEGRAGTATTKVKSGQVKIQRVLGFTMVPQENESVTRGMAASIITDSTPDCPKVLVHSEVKGQEGNYVVDINKVDPSDATQIEIFAFMEYEDSIGNGVGNKFGSYHTLKSMLNEGKHYKETLPEVNSTDMLLSIKKNWLSLLTEKVNEYSDITEPSVALLTRRAKSLQKLMEDWVQRRKAPTSSD